MHQSIRQHVQPRADQLFRIVTDSYGSRLALVFGNHAPEGQCPFLTASRCFHCDIGIGEGVAFDGETNRQRLAWYQEHFRDELTTAAHLVIYNSGSVLNPGEMPFEVLRDLLTWAASLESVQAISLDSREAFITRDRIVRIAAQLRDDQCMRIIIGIESADDYIRNTVLQKAMAYNAIQRAFDEIAAAAEVVGPHRVGIDVNILVGGPGTTLETAIGDALETARFALSRSKSQIDFNLHPYYPSSRGLARFPKHARCSMPILIHAVRAVKSACVASGRGSRIFIGLNDEGHDTDRSGKDADLRSIYPAIRSFNADQELNTLLNLASMDEHRMSSVRN